MEIMTLLSELYHGFPNIFCYYYHYHHRFGIFSIYAFRRQFAL